MPLKNSFAERQPFVAVLVAASMVLATACAKARVFHALAGSSAAGSAALDKVKMQDAVHFAKKWLTGDLYRKLAFEGEGLTRLRLKAEVEGLEREIARLG